MISYLTVKKSIRWDKITCPRSSQGHHAGKHWGWIWFAGQEGGCGTEKVEICGGLGRVWECRNVMTCVWTCVSGQSGIGSPASSRPTVDINTTFIFSAVASHHPTFPELHGLPTGPCLPLPASVYVPHSSRVQLDSWLWHSSASPSRRAACIDPLHSRPHPPVCFCGRAVTLPSLCLARQPSPDSQPAVFLQALPCFYSKAASGKCLPGTFT